MILRSKDIIRILLKQDLVLKLLTLALAIAVWGFTVISRESQQELRLPIEVRHIPAGYTAELPREKEISFTLSAPPFRIRTAKNNNKSVILDLKGAIAPGKTVFSNLDKHLQLHNGIRVIRVSPASFELELLKNQHIDQKEN